MAGASVAEYFRDEGYDVLFFIDNVFRFAQAGSELSTITKTLPSEDGYQPTLTSEMAALHERLVSDRSAHVSTIEAIYVPSDDLLDTGVVAIYPYLDSVVTLSRDVYQEGRFPSIDLLGVSSSILSPDIVGQEHAGLVLEARHILKKAQEMEKMVSLVGEKELSLENQVIYHRAGLIKNYMTQPFFTTEAQSGKKGVFVGLSDTISDMKAIIEGKHDKVEAYKFLFIGKIG